MSAAAFTPKILHVLDHSLPVQSGYSVRTESLLTEQDRRGWRPVGLTAPEHNLLLSDAPAYEIIGAANYHRTVLARGATVPCNRIRLMPRFVARIAEVAALEKPDLLHVHSPVFNALPALWLRSRLELPLVYEIRAFWEDASVDHGVYSERSLRYHVTHLLEMQVCRRAEQIVALCAGIQNRLVAAGINRNKITIVPNGVDIEKFKPKSADARDLEGLRLGGKQVIGYIGSFYRYEGLDLLIEAVARLVPQRKDLALLLIGAGRMEARLRAQIHRLGLGQTVFLMGNIPHERIPALYALMDVLVYPRYSVPLTERVTPLKPLEAMAMGKAVLASDIGGHRELIQEGETGMLFRAGDISALCTALARLLDNDALRRSYERGAAAARTRISWEITAAAYESVYKRALGDTRVTEELEQPCLN
jgi:PEP-CTERM/exosortase A-associated glycosyltransferase